MREDLRRRRGFRRQLGRRTPSQPCRTDLALALVEPFPDTLQGPIAEMAVGGADGREDAAGGGALEELPQTARGQAEPPDLGYRPDGAADKTVLQLVQVRPCHLLDRTRSDATARGRQPTEFGVV
jgi:hypothetical protein